jgi:hypothetical protein
LIQVEPKESVIGILGAGIVGRDDRAGMRQHVVQPLEKQRVDNCQVTRVLMGGLPSRCRAPLAERKRHLVHERDDDLRCPSQSFNDSRGGVHTLALYAIGSGLTLEPSSLDSTTRRTASAPAGFGNDLTQYGCIHSQPD